MDAWVTEQAKVWNNFHERWAGLKPPLRPHQAVTEAIEQAVQAHEAHVLLLGVTPEFAHIGQQLTALERSPDMINLIWPGNTPERRAVLGNWLSPDFQGKLFSAVIGDGVLSCIQYPHDYVTLFDQMMSVMQPNSRLVFRLFASPESGETVDEVVDAICNHEIKSFHAFKWRLAMAIVFERQDANIPVRIIHQVFNDKFANRQALSDITGWSLNTIREIDAYQDSHDVFSFPTLMQIQSTIPGAWGRVQICPVGTYELAERCPLLIVEFPHES